MASLPLSYAEGCKKRLVAPTGAVSGDEWEQMSLVDKWKTSYRNEYIDQSIRWWAELASISIFWFTATSELFTFTFYIIPEYFVHYPHMFRTSFSIFVTYVYLQCTFHWLCTRFCKSSLEKTPIFKVPSSGYKRCNACGIIQPPRTHHCKICDVCIKKRDHHCFFTGTCIGFWNQRYFVVMNFHVTGASLGGLLFTTLYLAQEYTPSSYWDYFLPVTLYNWLIVGAVDFKFMLMITHLYTLVLTGAAGAGFFLTQTYAIYHGKTTHEINKKTNIRSTSSVAHNFRSVFGNYWMLNLWLPTQFLWIQPGDGIHWDNNK